MEFGLLAAALVAVGTVRLVLAFEQGRTNPPERTSAAWDAAIVAGLIGLGVGRIGAMLSGGTNPLAHPLDVVIIRGGVDTVPAVIGAVIAFTIVARHDLRATADAVAPAVLAGLAGWHAACFTRGACLGSATDLPWAVGGPSGAGRHPVEVYAALLLAAAALALILVKRRHPFAGVVAAVGFAAAAAARLATEPMRLAIGSDLRWWYAAGTALGIAGALSAWRFGVRRT